MYVLYVNWKIEGRVAVIQNGESILYVACWIMVMHRIFCPSKSNGKLAYFVK